MDTHYNINAEKATLSSVLPVAPPVFPQAIPEVSIRMIIWNVDAFCSWVLFEYIACNEMLIKTVYVHACFC